MTKDYQSLSAPAFSLIYWTTDSCLVNDPNDSEVIEEIEMQND